MVLQYNLISHEGFENITVFDPNKSQLLSASSDHPAFDRIKEGIVAGDESALALFDVSTGINEAFKKVSERVSIRSGNVYLDNEVIDGSLTDQIIRFYEESGDFNPLVKFLENVANNPSDHSRRQLYDWLRDREFTIDSDGHIIGYKGVRTSVVDGETKYESISHGNAIVDGVEHEGAIPNYVGAVVEMPRSQVTFDPLVACNVGLHAGTWRYASVFAQGATLTVSINPRDVVSVPRDSHSEKIRVCRYTVLDVVLSPYASAYHDTSVTDDAIDYNEVDEDDVEYYDSPYLYDDDEDEDDYDNEENEDLDEEQTVELDESPDAVADEDPAVEAPVDSVPSSDETVDPMVEEKPEDVKVEDQSKSDEDDEDSDEEDSYQVNDHSQVNVFDVNSYNQNLSKVTNWGTWGSN